MERIREAPDPDARMEIMEERMDAMDAMMVGM